MKRKFITIVAVLFILSTILFSGCCTTQMYTPTEYEFDGPGVILESSQSALGASSKEMLLCYGYNQGYKHGIILGEDITFSTCDVPHFYTYQVQGPIAPITKLDYYTSTEIKYKNIITILFTNDEDLLKEASSQGFKSLQTDKYKDVFKTVDTNETLTIIGSTLLGGLTIGITVAICQ